MRAWLSLFPRATTRARKVAAIRRLDAYVRRTLGEKGLGWRPASPKLPHSLPRALPESQLSSFLQRLDESEASFTFLRDRLLIELLYGCGLRRGEAVSLKVSQVHLPLHQLHILGKGSKWRIVPVYPRLQELLQKYIVLRTQLAPSHDYLLCTDKGKPLYPRAVHRIVRRHLGTHPHALRHSFATHLLSRGASVQAVRELLGHSSLATTQKYLAITPEELRSAYLRTHPRA